MIAKLIKAIQFYSKAYDNLMLIGNWPKLFSSIPKDMTILCWSQTYQSCSVLFQNIWQSHNDQKLLKGIEFYSKRYDNLTLIGNLSRLFSSIPKHMRILRSLETYQSYSVLFQNIWQSYFNQKLNKTAQFYSKTYDNLTMIRNFSKVLSSIPKDMTIWHWSETYQGYSVLFQNTWESYVHWKLIRAIQFCSKTYDNLTLIRNLTKLLSSIPKYMRILRLSGNLLKPYSSIPRHMRILSWSETYRSYSVVFKIMWQSYIDRKLIKAIQFYFERYANLRMIGNLSKLFSSIPKHITTLRWSRNLSKLYSSISKHMTILHWAETY